METMTSGITPVYDMGEKNGAFGGNGAIWIVLVLFLFLGGGSFGGRNGIQDNFISSEFIKRDLFNINQNISGNGAQTQRDILESRYTNQLGLQNMQEALQSCCCNTQKEIIENRYTNQLGLQNLGQQLSSCCCETNRNIDSVRADAYRNTCEITTAIHAEGEQTRALINAQAMQDLRDKLADRDRALMVANFQSSQQAQSASLISALQPTPKPAYLTCSPYFSYNVGGCPGCGNI